MDVKGNLNIKIEKIKFLSRFHKSQKQKQKNEKKDRGALITFRDLEKRFLVHNGKTYISIFIRPFMLGYRFGSFVLTKRRLNAIHADKNKKGKLKTKSDLKGSKDKKK
jgi:ribosomal protein S19